MFKQEIKKNTIIAIIFLFIFSSLFFIKPLDSFAIGGVGDNVIVTDILLDSSPTSITRNAALSEITFSSGTSATMDTTLVQKETWLDGLAWTAANVIIDQFGDAIVDWIRNGFDGSPMFLSDPEGFFRDTANQISGAIINDLNLNWLCDPFGKLNIDIDFFFPGTDRTKYECTFDEIASTFESYADRDDISDWINLTVNTNERNIVRSYGSDYRNGGFLMWLFSAQKKNNSLGRTLLTADEVYAGVNARVGFEGFQLNFNQGFFGVRKCVEWSGPDRSILQGNEGEEPAKDAECLKYETKTPGQLVQDQLNDVGGKDLSRLQVADEIDEIIGALATTMMGWLLTGGNEEGGVLGYDKNADYSGTNRDHYGELSKSQELGQKKADISQQISIIENNEKPYSDRLNDYSSALYDTKGELEITLAKLKCIRATSTNDTFNLYPDSDCDGVDEDTQNIILSAVDKTESDINSDISNIENKIADIDGEIAYFNGKYGADAAETSAQAMELFDEFENEVMSATKLGEIKNIEEEYCYEYNKKNETGTICGVFSETFTSPDVYISAGNNPVIRDINTGLAKTKIYWKAINAEYCEATGGDGDKTWKKTTISTSGSYTTTSFEDGEERNYGVECFDAENTETSDFVNVSADGSLVAEMTGDLFAKSEIVKPDETSSLYWLSTNTGQCYLYSDKDSFDEDAEYVSDSAESWFKEAGYYLKTNYLNRTSGQETGIINSGETYQYKLICGDSGDNYGVLSELEITSESEENSEKEYYTTHTDKEFKNLNKETSKIETEMESVRLESACILNDYTQAENVSQAECGSFESSSLPNEQASSSSSP